MNKELLIYLCAVHSIILAMFHIAFWKIFKWSDLKSIGFANKAIIQILNTRLIYIFLFTAYLCVFFTNDLHSTNLGKAYMTGMSIFWLGRVVEQFIFLRVNNTFIHLLTLLFIAGVILFLLPVL